MKLLKQIIAYVIFSLGTALIVCVLGIVYACIWSALFLVCCFDKEPCEQDGVLK